MDELQLKYNSLDVTSQKEVMDFIDFLTVKMKRSKKKSGDRKELLTVSTWSDSDIKVIEDAQALIKFNPQEW